MRNARARAHFGAASEIQRSDEQWRKVLTPEQYAVLRRGHIERPFNSCAPAFEPAPAHVPDRPGRPGH
jgi:hypothetical protein